MNVSEYNNDFNSLKVDGLSTSQICTPVRKKFKRLPSSSPAYRSPLIQNIVKKVCSEPENLSIDALRASTKELLLKNQQLERDIQELEKKGFSEEQLKWYVEKLHHYNEIKDVAQMVMGRLATFAETTVRKIHEKYGMTDQD